MSMHSKSDILIENETISLIGKNLTHPNAEVIERNWQLIMPGGMDPHVHLDLPMFVTVSPDDHYTGHKAAAFGGTTTAMDFVVLEDQGFEYSLTREWRTAKAAIDYSFHMNLTHFNEKIAAELPSLMKMGIQTLKVFTAYNGQFRLDDGGIFRALRIAKDNGMLMMAHCENGDVIDLFSPGTSGGPHRSRLARVDRPRWGAVDATPHAAMAEQADASVYLVHMKWAAKWICLNMHVIAKSK